MDGDPSTWWEPERTDSLENWFLEIDLGRSVIAQQVVVRFAGEGQGDPFLKFRVMGSDGTEGRGRDRGLAFFNIGKVFWRNKEQREFRFEVRPQHPQPEGMDGEVVQIVRFEGVDTDGPRGQEVSVEEYRLLEPVEQGAVDYYRQTVAGRNILIDEETYRDLPEEEKGPVRHFRYERPRLTELEVHTPGDNVVTLTKRMLIREMSLFENVLLVLATDGFYRSAYFMRPYDPLRNKYQLEIDLGTKFWLERVRLLSYTDPLDAYQVRISDGSLDPAGALIWTTFDERLNEESFLQVEERFPLQEVRFIEVRRLEVVGAASETGVLNEVQAYGEGYVPEVTLTSPLIRLDRSWIFTAVRWEGEALPDTRVEIRTRSGDELLKVEEYYDKIGRRVSKEEWESMREWNRGERILRDIPGLDWSDWSEPYRASGEPFRSPSPRRYALAQVQLLTRNPLRRVTIRSLELDLAPPLVDQVLAEIWPLQGVRPGADQAFALYVRPRFRVGDSGFDRMRIRSSSVAPIELVALEAGTEAQLRSGGGQPLWPGEVELEELEDGGVELVFPDPVRWSNLVYVARFRTRVFLSGTSFAAEITRAIRPGVVQVATQGDASASVPGQSLVVIADLEDTPMLDGVRMESAVLTPNGDGINDETEIGFSVFRLRKEHLLRVEVFDLSGRRVRDLSARRERPSGEHAFSWDGRDHGGRLVAPGIYLVRVGFDTDADASGTEAVGVVHVAY